MKKIKILHLIPGLGIGGAEKVVYDLTRFANPLAFEVTVLVTGKTNGMLPDFKKNNIDVRFIDPKKTSFRLSGIIHRIQQTIQLITTINKEKKITILHAHMSYAGILALFIKAKFPKIQVVFTSHNHNLESKLTDLILFLSKKIRAADILFSKKMQRKVYKKNAIIIPNGIATKEYELEVPKFDNFTFLCIGRLEEQKNQLALIAPVKALKKRGYTFQILLVGEGSYRKQLEQEIRANNLQSHLKLLGIRKDIPKLCNQAHGLILSSLWEGFPLVLLEAGASKLPVITTNVGSIPDLIDSQELGFLLQDVQELESVMATFMEDYTAAKIKGSYLNKKVKKKYDIQSIVKQHENLYQQLVNNLEQREENREKRQNTVYFR